MLQIKKLAIFSLLFSSVFLPFNAAQAQTDPAPIVLEIFTSKFCPACPNGDRNFINALNDNPNIIGLSCHVTYFDRTARKDALSKPFCNARQGIYKMALNTGKIYTPMMVVNGQEVTTGIKPSELNAALDKTAPLKHVINLRKHGQYLDIKMPQIRLEKDVEIWLFEIENNLSQSGYEHYENSVTNITRLMSWDGGSINMAYPITNDANHSYAVVAQSYKGGIIAAGKTTD